MLPLPAIVIVQASQPSPPPVITVKASGDALLIWNAADAVLDIVKRGVPNDEGIKSIELRGARLLLDKCGELSAATTCALRIIYPHDPQFSTQYQVELITSMERLMIIKAARQSLLADKSQIMSSLDGGNMPTDIKVTVTGKLPASKV